MTVKAVKGGYRLFSKSKPDRALGPVRSSPEDVVSKDEKRVQFFKNLSKSSGGPGSLASKVKPSLVKEVKGSSNSVEEPMQEASAKSNLGTKRIISAESAAGSTSNLPSMQAAKARRTKVRTTKAGSGK